MTARMLLVKRCLSSANVAFARQLHCSHRNSAGVRALYDGECPVCVKEIQMLQFLQKNRREKVEFVDISLEGYDEAKYGGISYERAMEEMHVIDENDQVHVGVPAFNVMYSAVGLGWLGSLISLPLIRPVTDCAYAIFAKNRLRWTGRGDECTTGRCEKKKV
ncbi:uncharacterized protein LOC134456895 [Engraulis encrasicolus]|uniref:uncharacterized protein LOC134456895 n=1 Tax=Engraulis encrasicolus TaxID=184585 RepID=UPI002FD72747